MFPSQPLDLVPGDQVQYIWADPRNVHTVAFPTGSASLPESFGFDCGTSFVSVPATPGAPPPTVCFEPGAQTPEGIGDPGNAGSGTALTDPTKLVDAGLMLGTDYGLNSAPAKWSIVTNSGTKFGSYNFQCIIHDYMHGTLNVRAPEFARTASDTIAGNRGGAFNYYQISSPSGAATMLTLGYSPFNAPLAHGVGINVYQNGKTLGSAMGQATGLGDNTNSGTMTVTVTPSATGGPVLIQVFNYGTDTVTYTLSSS